MHTAGILLQQIHGNLPSAPIEYDTWSPPRHKSRRTSIKGLRLRYSSLRASKIMSTRAPVTPYPTSPNVYPTFPWTSKEFPNGVGYMPVMNIKYLISTVVPEVRLSDPALADHLQSCYSKGHDSSSRLPVDAVRLVAKNGVVPGTPRGNAIDDMLRNMREDSRLISTTAPLPGTVVMPVSCDISIKYRGPTLKVRDTMDSKSPRHTRSSPGHHFHGEDRNFTQESIFSVMADCAAYHVEAFGAEDLRRAFTQMSERPDQVCRNAIFWKFSDHGTWRWHYFRGYMFGNVPTPAVFDRHMFGVTKVIQREVDKTITELSSSSHTTCPIHRNVDDFLLLFPKGTSVFQPHVTRTLRQILASAAIPRSHEKAVPISKRVIYNGFLFVAGKFKNSLGVTSVGVGFDKKRCFKITEATRAAIRGLDRKGIESFLGLASWTSPVIPHAKPLISSYRKAAMECEDSTYVPDRHIQADLQRFKELFKRELLVPIHMLLCLSPPRRVVYTDASGSPFQGRPPFLGGYDDSESVGFFYTYQLPTELYVQTTTASKQELTNSTTFLELLAFWLILWYAAERGWYGRTREGFAIRWYTDCMCAADAWRKQSSGSSRCNNLIKLISTLCVQRRIYVEATFIPREENQAADALTHDDISQFSSLTGIGPDRRHVIEHLPLSLALNQR